MGVEVVGSPVWEGGPGWEEEVSIVGHSWAATTGEVEKGESGHPRLHSWCEASLGYMR